MGVRLSTYHILLQSIFKLLKRIIMKKLILSLSVLVAFSSLVAQNTKYDTNTGGAGSGNASLGVGTLPVTSATGNTALGINAMNANSTGASNSAVGNGAMKMNSSGYGNSALGQNALYSNTSGQVNVAIGLHALYANTIGNGNAAIGYGALASNTEGHSNIAIGSSALQLSTWTAYNVAIGTSALQSNTDGGENVGIGGAALYTNKQGNSNTSIGRSSMVLNTSGSNNAAYGRFALKMNTTGSGNSAIGTEADVTSGSLSNATAIGFKAKVDASDKVVIGNSSVTSIGGWANWSNYSDVRLKKDIKNSKLGLNFILKLRPVTYFYNVEGQEKAPQTGLIAQEVESAAKEAGENFSGIDKSSVENGGYYALRYASFTMPLIKAIQEQEAVIQELKQEIAALKSTMSPQSATDSDENMLEQNSPNPTNEVTTIKFHLAKSAQNAALMIFDMSGRLVKTYTLTKNKSSIQVNRQDLQAGMYIYSLVVEGKEVQSKKMIMQ
jgi:trimeric autotransporter adhesin